MVLGSLYLGIATPTEAAGVGVVGALLAMLVNGRMSLASLRHAIEETTKVTVMLYWLFFGSSALIGVYTLAGGTRLIQDTMTSLPLEPIYIIIMFQFIWIILGCFIDWIGILFLTAPIFVPIAEKLGFDLVWLGVLFCLNMQISYISPPFGPAAFYLKGVTPPGITLEPHLRVDLAIYHPPVHRPGAGHRLSPDRALAAEHHGALERVMRASSTRWSTSCGCRSTAIPASLSFRSATSMPSTT